MKKGKTSIIFLLVLVVLMVMYTLGIGIFDITEEENSTKEEIIDEEIEEENEEEEDGFGGIPLIYLVLSAALFYFLFFRKRRKVRKKDGVRKLKKESIIKSSIKDVGGKIKMVKPEKEFNYKKLVTWIFIVIGVLLFVLGSVYTVSAGYRGVVLTWGKPSEVVADEGFHLKIPIAQTVKKMEVRTQKIEVEADSASKDLQDVKTTVALNYHVIPSEANKLYQEIGESYRERIIHPALQETIRAVTANYVAEELITKRAMVREDIRDLLRERLLTSHIIVDDFNIVNFQFSEEFDKAIEAKVTAEQLKLKADRDLERIRVEKEQIITRAEAEAEALRIQKQELTPDLIKLRQIEMQRLAVEKWNGIMPQATSGMPFIDITPSTLKNE